MRNVLLHRLSLSHTPILTYAHPNIHTHTHTHTPLASNLLSVVCVRPQGREVSEGSQMSVASLRISSRCAAPAESQEGGHPARLAAAAAVYKPAPSPHFLLPACGNELVNRLPTLRKQSSPSLSVRNTHTLSLSHTHTKTHMRRQHRANWP